jgi:hypothetical protein
MRIPRSIGPLVALAAACSVPPPPLPPPPPRPATAPASWTPFDAPPLEGATRAVARGREREVRLDLADTRWLYRGGVEPVRSAGFETSPLAWLLLLDEGTVAVTEDGRFLYAPDDIGPWQEPLAALPDAGELRGVSVYRGGITVRGRRGVGCLRIPTGASDGGAPELAWLPPFEGRLALDARIGADCAGLVVFSPQRLAATRDCGRTVQPLDDRGVFAGSLVADGDRIVVTPGGDHDVFARAFVPGASRLARAFSPRDDERPSSGGEQPSALARAEDPGSRSLADFRERAPGDRTPMRASPPSWRSRHDYETAVEGDRVFLLSASASLAAGTLGGGFTSFGRKAKNCRERRVGFSACGGTRVLGCKGEAHAWTEAGEAPAFEDAAQELARHWVTEIALQNAHDLFYLEGRELHRIDLRDPSRAALLTPVQLAPEARLHTRCDGTGRSPVWIGATQVVSEAAARDPAARATAVVLPASFEREPAVLGFARDGSLLVRDRKAGRIAVLHEDGSAEERPMPGSGDPGPDALAVAFNDDGRGLAIERASGRAFQSLDAGATWTPTRGPGRPIGRAEIFCTETRCEVEGLFLRRGWDEAAPLSGASPHRAAALGSAPPASGGSAPVLDRAAPPKAPDTPVVACERAPAGAPHLPAGIPPEGISPGFGPSGALWAATAVISGPPDEGKSARRRSELRMRKTAGKPVSKEWQVAQRSLWMLVGTADGRVTKTLAGAWEGTEESTDSTVLARDGVLFAWMEPGKLGAGVTEVTSTPAALSPGEGLTPPRRVKGSLGDWGRSGPPLSEVPVVTAAGLAVHDHRRHTVRWFDRAGKLTTRVWPDHPVGTSFDDALVGAFDRFVLMRGWGAWVALAATPDGTWIAVETADQAVRLVSVAPDGVMATRLSVLAHQAERGAGILAAGAEIDVALVEQDESGAPALRLHRVDGDLGLGPPRTVPGTRGADGALLPLPACTATLPAGAMDLGREVEVRVAGKTERAALVRRVRFDAAGACVDRSMLAGSSGLRVVTRGGLDGPGVLAASGPITGARCRVLP